jgi:hypothetical protein
MANKNLPKYQFIIWLLIFITSFCLLSYGEALYLQKQDSDILSVKAYQFSIDILKEKLPNVETITEYDQDKVLEEAPNVFQVTLEGTKGSIWYCVIQYMELENTFKVIELVEAVTANETVTGEDSSIKEEFKEGEIKGGILTHDETWSGQILVTKHIVVPEGVKLTIEPGTKVRFKHYRGYKEPGKRIGLEVNGGTLLALGKPNQQIWFTSDAEEPINGDWLEIFLNNTKTSRLDYVIVEFSLLGIKQFDSEVPVTNSIIRWTNTEGLYAERSTPVFKNNTLYENGYHEIALEHYNRDVTIRNNIFRNGCVAIHFQETTALVENNYFTNYDNEVISVCADSEVIIRNNKFRNFGNKKMVILTESESSAIIERNDFDKGNLPIPSFDYEDIQDHKLGYIPGDPEDRYLYVFDAEDETRRVIKRIGEGLGFSWSLFYAEGFLWTFSFEAQGFVRIDPSTGEYKIYKNDGEMLIARGLVYDGEYFWANDFSRLKIIKFKLYGDAIKIIDSFDVPEKENGGTVGLAYDGEFLLYHSRDGRRLYKIDQEGKINDIIEIKIDAKHREISGPFVWTGEYFWTVGDKGLAKLTADGELVGEIYGVADGVFAIAWDGQYLWTFQRTCEMWDDAKIFHIEIIDDSLF